MNRPRSHPQVRSQYERTQLGRAGRCEHGRHPREALARGLSYVCVSFPRLPAVFQRALTLLTHARARAPLTVHRLTNDSQSEAVNSFLCLTLHLHAKMLELARHKKGGGLSLLFAKSDMPPRKVLHEPKTSQQKVKGPPRSCRAPSR